MLENFKAYQLAKKHHLLCKQLKLPLYLADQLRRASSSVALNLAEGSGRRTWKERRQAYSIALGSLRECTAILEVEDIDEAELLQANNELSAIIYTLVTRARPRNTAL